MARFGKYTSLIYLLALVASLEFIGLAGFLVSDSQRRAEASAAWQEEPAEDDTIPEWLEPSPQAVLEKDKPEGELAGAEILAQSKIVTHAMGSVGGDAMLNCLEGFQAMYAKGVRVFEADLRMTSDQKVVLRHDWRAGWQTGVSESSIPALEEFLNTPLMGKYTPMSFQDLLLLMEQYPDICIVTDTKFTEPEFVRMQFDAMVQDAADLGLSYVLDRLVVQIYSPQMFEVADSVHHFNAYIYTLYQDAFEGTAEAFRERAGFCAENGILGITIWDRLWKPAYADIAAEYGLAVYIHTVNDREEAAVFLEDGISGVYSDTLIPENLEPEQEPDTAETEAENGEDTGHTDDNTNDAEGETQ